MHIWIGALTALCVLAIGAAVILLRNARAERRLAQQRLLDDLTEEAESAESGVRLVHAIHRVGELVSGDGFSRNLAQNLARAGYHGTAAPAIYMGLKTLLLALALPALGIPLMRVEGPMPLRAFLVALGASLFFMLPNWAVRLRRARRAREIQSHLPDAIDLLEICVSSGMGLDMAWNAVADETRRISPVLADEMELTSLEINLGVARPAALRAMSERTGAQEISSLVALMVQSERFGASIVDALHAFATSMREQHSNQVEEAAEKMAVKMLAPMVLFIFPTLLVIAVGPAVMRIVEVMG